ncbi:uncharacterized protein LOC110725026 [Chenopodium quinoa]|uniref:uncharacterized protein LOC110725026 n=1 Tax=Chenopodium quinoa TaxID=63459 RepID=UPI000B79A36D|nr:uncharacterized protein LOC110725026 [Chenopodium quinoa]
MSSKLKPFLENIISIDQSAFVPKRLITDNALVTFEIFHAMKRRGEGKDGTIALKLDMRKAYDRVEWSFKERVMMKMGFYDGWVRRILECLSSVSFAFKINGKISGSVVPSWGLCRGDLISPYLFLIVADAFSTLLSKAASDRLIHGARICRGAPRVSHLFFADDRLLFAKATVSECSMIASGQSVNLTKTDVVFSKNVSDSRSVENVGILGVREVERHENYLGLPTISSKSKKAIFASLKERIWWKIQGWKEKLLSRPGKEIQIKAIAQTSNVANGRDKIQQLFPNEVCALILQIPLSTNMPNDMRYWGHTKNGVHSVRMAYWLGKLGVAQTGNIAGNYIDQRVWRVTWSVGGPPKLGNFV